MPVDDNGQSGYCDERVPKRADFGSEPVAMSTVAQMERVITAEEFAAEPDDRRTELVQGTVVEMPPPGWLHKELHHAGFPRKQNRTAQIDHGGEELVGSEWAEWYMMTPQERWAETEKLWATYLELGGSLDPEPDTQSPFFDEDEWREIRLDGRPGMRVVRRSGI